MTLTTQLSRAYCQWLYYGNVNWPHGATGFSVGNLFGIAQHLSMAFVLKDSNVSVECRFLVKTFKVHSTFYCYAYNYKTNFHKTEFVIPRKYDARLRHSPAQFLNDWRPLRHSPVWSLNDWETTTPLTSPITERLQTAALLTSPITARPETGNASPLLCDKICHLRVRSVTSSSRALSIRIQ